jgi:hypothetical protein
VATGKFNSPTLCKFGGAIGRGKSEPLSAHKYMTYAWINMIGNRAMHPDINSVLCCFQQAKRMEKH